MRFKTNLTNQQKIELLRKIISVEKYTKISDKYFHLITILKPIISDHTITDFSKKLIPGFTIEQFDHKWEQLEKTEKKYKTKTGLHLAGFKFVEDIIKSSDLNYSAGSRTNHITPEEIQYFLYRLTSILFSKNGYTNTMSRNYFMSAGFKKEYKKVTKRCISKEKISHFNKLFCKYNLVTIFTKSKKNNLYVIGQNNPYINFQGILEEKELKDFCEMKKQYNKPTKEINEKEIIEKLIEENKNLKAKIAELEEEKMELVKMEEEHIVTIKKLIQNEINTEEIKDINEIDTEEDETFTYEDETFSYMGLMVKGSQVSDICTYSKNYGKRF